MEDSFFSSKSTTKNNEINNIKTSINEDINDIKHNNENVNEDENSENEMKISVKKEILNSAYTVEDACELIKNVFAAAGEREISVGDGVDIIISNNPDINTIANTYFPFPSRSKNIFY